MSNERDSGEEDKYIQTKESIVNNLKSQKETEKQYLTTVDNLLSYWISELGQTSHKDEERREELLKLIDTERGTIKKKMEMISTGSMR